MTNARVAELTRLGAAEAARRIAAGELTSLALVEACLERIAQREEEVRAWAHLDPAAAITQARERDAASAPRGPLHGVPVGVKDIVDTEGLPTECGTPIHAGRRPAPPAAARAPRRAPRAAGRRATRRASRACARPAPSCSARPSRPSSPTTSRRRRATRRRRGARR